MAGFLSKSFFILLFGVLIWGAYQSTQIQLSTHWNQWEEARKHYDAGRLSEAIQSLNQYPTGDGSYHYNLGTAYLRQGKLGLAVAHLEKANSLRPHDPWIIANLKIARTKLTPPPPEDAISWAESIGDALPLSEARSILGLGGLLFVLLTFGPYWRTRSIRQTILHPAGLFAAILFTLTTSIYLLKLSTSQQPAAVLTAVETTRSGPGDGYLKLARLDVGLKLRVLGPVMRGTRGDQETTWLQVRYGWDSQGDGQIGWVPESVLLLL